MYKKQIQEILNYKDHLLFYEIMKYPIPKEWQYFLCEKKYLWDIKKNNGFSRDKPNKYLIEYLEIIKKHGWLFKSLPFVKTIYLCNSITFNKLEEDSDIDLFIITKQNSLRLARFFSVVLFFLLWLKRTKRNKSRKYCLSFYVTEDQLNLYNISLPQTDIYLTYRLAHLVLLYNEDKTLEDIYKHNKWIYPILPNLSKEYHINLWLDIFYGTTSFKRFIEKVLRWFFWGIIENLIRTLRLPIVIYKTKKLKENWWWIVINKFMLKFHLDQRKRISLIYKTRKNSL